MTGSILIVIPAFNEDTTISQVVKNCKKFGDVLVINDGSIDKTMFLAKRSGAIVLSNKKNFGYEYSLNVGHSYALKNQYEIMITFDADGQLPYTSIPAFIELIQNGVDIVIGKRIRIKRFTEKILAKLAFLVCGVADPYCGMKAYNLKANKQKYFSRYNSVGTALTLDYIEKKLSFKNVDIKVTSRNGQSKFGGTLMSELRMLYSLFTGLRKLFLIWVSQKSFFNLTKKVASQNGKSRSNS